jgi:3',5'-cyclic AMP phosphodiesterase CpdA
VTDPPGDPPTGPERAGGRATGPERAGGRATGPDPVSGPDPACGVVIAHVSDIHIGAHDRDAVRRLVTDLRAAGPALTVVTGDLTMRARPAEFRAAAALLELLPGPRLVVPGNHDVPLRDPVARLLRPYRGYRRAIAGWEPVVDVPGVRVLGLASVARWRWKAGRITRVQCARIVEVFAGTAPGTVRVLAMHHPVSEGGLFGRRRLLRALREARVDVVLAGHTHLPGMTVLAPGTVELIAGTATSTRTRGAGRQWSLVRVGAGAVSVRRRGIISYG